MKKQFKMLMLTTALVAALPVMAVAAGIIDLPRTGQTRCYDTAGKEITCVGSGQDGALRAGAPIPSPRYIDNGDGTVTDRMTGLIWLKNANCFGSKNWTDSLTAAGTLASEACGLKDGSKAGEWRLPNKEELMSLVDISRIAPSLSAGHPFVNVSYGNAYYGPNRYWSSSSASADGGSAWIVSFYGGDALYESKANGNEPYYSTRCVWPVRGGQ